MASQKVPKDREDYTGPDKAFYEQSGGRLTPSPSMANDDGFGTPPEPGLRGEAYGGHVKNGESMGGRNKEIDQFFKGKRGK
jgi:hypothetical protein